MKNPFLIIAVAEFLGSVSATAKKFSRSLKTPDDVGAAHTDAFRRIGEKYAQKKPESKLDLVMDVAEITASYCDNYYEDLRKSYSIMYNDERNTLIDLEQKNCHAKAHETTFKTFSDSTSLDKKSVHDALEPEFPEDMHPFVVDTINEMHAIIDGLHEDNLDDVIDALLDLKEEINNTDSDNLNEAHKVAASVGLSVAIESSKLWHSVLTDVDHPLHEMQGYLGRFTDVDSNDERENSNHNRRMQDQTMTAIAMNFIIGADVLGALSGSIAGLVTGLVSGVGAGAMQFQQQGLPQAAGDSNSTSEISSETTSESNSMPMIASMSASMILSSMITSIPASSMAFFTFFF